MTKYSDHFTQEELADERTGKIRLQVGFIDQLEMLREAYGFAMPITDGCRSSDTNTWLIERGYKASLRSFHLMYNSFYGTDTCAVDMSRPSGDRLWKLVGAAKDLGWTVGIGSNFIHLDLRARYTNLPPVIYTYY